MPTNLPPEYYEAEKFYKEAQTPSEKISTLEDLISTIPKHKGTDKLRADLRRKLSKMKEAAQTRKRTGGAQSPYQIDREGAGQVVIIGTANVGKSALVAALTNASPEVSPAPYSTWRPTPGMMSYEDVQIQLIDTPPMDKDYLESELFELIKRCDLLLLVVDLQTYPVQQIDSIVEILVKHRIIPQHLKDQYPHDRRMTYVPMLVIANKCDDENCDEVFDIFCQLLEDDMPLLPTSVIAERNLGLLKKILFEKLEIMRVYSKPPGQEPDYSSPFVMKKGGTVEELAGKIHQDFANNLKAARVWGSSAFDGQMVQREYVLHDGDVVELRI